MRPQRPIFDGAPDRSGLLAGAGRLCGGRCNCWVDKVVELQIAPSVSAMTVQRSLKKNELQHHLSKYWKIPTKHSAAFAASMEEVLDVYHLPYASAYPVVCMDES